MAQGKAWNKRRVLNILQPYFKAGMSVQAACETAGIPRTTVQTWIDNDEHLRLKITSWQRNLLFKARSNVKEVVEGPKSEEQIATSKWLLESRDPEFMKKVAVASTTMSVEEFAKRFEISEGEEEASIPENPDNSKDE